ncbi:MAG: hypothetical protein MZU91_00815 [Desulfosudis oleivorans]|nr:hypothetical protein [Desulfosudis oleivorans]
MAPHPPFVFGPERGSPRAGLPVLHGRRRPAPRRTIRGPSTDYIVRYREQLAFLNTRILDAVDAILDRSAEPPVIVIQGDHGSRAYADFDRPGGLLPQGEPGHPQRAPSARSGRRPRASRDLPGQHLPAHLPRLFRRRAGAPARRERLDDLAPALPVPALRSGLLRGIDRSRPSPRESPSRPPSRCGDGPPGKRGR